MKILYVAPYTAAGDHYDSGVIGYGETSGAAITRELARLGHVVDRVPSRRGPAKLAHIYSTYEQLSKLALRNFDLLFMYNTHHQFAAELRRLLTEQKADNVLLTGYTHGSHWDPTDLIRHTDPMLRYADLGNIMAMDLVFLVTQYMRDVIYATVSAELGRPTADRFGERACVVGGTIDTDRLEAARAPRADSPIIAFNHSPTPAKRPATFFRAAGTILRRHQDVRIFVSRRFGSDDPGYAELAELRTQFGERVVEGKTLPIDEYFRWLWRSWLQVSTATHESFGVSTVEAIYTGCCSVLPPTGAYPEVAGGAGLYEEGELVETLERYLADDALRAETLARQQKAIERYYPAVVAARIARAAERRSAGHAIGFGEGDVSTED